MYTDYVKTWVLSQRAKGKQLHYSLGYNLYFSALLDFQLSAHLSECLSEA